MMVARFYRFAENGGLVGKNVNNTSVKLLRNEISPWEMEFSREQDLARNGQQE